MAVTTPGGPKGLFPDQTFIAVEVVPEALIFQIATIAGDIEGDEPAIRVPFVAEDFSVGFVAEGADIPLASPDLDELVIRTGKIATIVRMSNEAATYAAAGNLVSTSLSRAVAIKGNVALLSNVGTPLGLLGTVGIVDSGALGATDLDAIGEALTAIEVNGGTATHIVMDPGSWGVIRAMKTATGSALPLLGAPADQAERRLFGVEVIVTPEMTPGTILALDKSQIIAAAGPIKLASSTEVFFGSDSLARRVTWRIGWQVIHADRLAKVSVSLV